MLTDEELKELEAAVGPSIHTKDWNRDRFNALLRYGRKQSGPWDCDLSESEEWNRGDIPDDDDTDLILKCVEFTRDAIARERVMRQPLTAEICERLGVIDGSLEGEVFIDFSHGIASNLAVFDLCGSNIDINAKDHSLTVGHLFAAATLAGVELDWRKVAPPPG